METEGEEFFRANNNRWAIIFPGTKDSVDDPRINPMATGAPSLTKLAGQRLLVGTASEDPRTPRAQAYSDAVRDSGWRGKVEWFESDGEGHGFFVMNPGSRRADEVLSRKTESEIPEKDPQHPLHLIQNLLWVGLNSITYMRGIFNGTYFVEKSVETLAMKFNILMPMDAESRRLIDWIDTGISEALQKKYLKTLLFCICDKERSLVLEEYAFSFGYPNNSTEESVMTVRLTGSSKGYTAFASNASEVTPGQMRRSACKMIRLLISLMRTLDPLPEERAIFMKLLYYDDVTPRDYEPPFFKCCAENEAMTFPNKNQLKMEVGNANNNQLFPAVQNLIDSCNKNNSVASVDHELSEAKVLTSEEICYITTPNNDTLHAAQEAVLTSQMKDLMFSTRNALDDFSIPMAPKRTYGYVLVSSAKKIKFMLDSGATHHVCKDKSIMSNLKPLKEEDQVFLSSADGIELRAKEIGSVVTNAIKLSHVGYIPEMAFNVVSVAQLARQGLLIDIANGHFSIISPSDVRLVGEGDLQKRRDKATGRDYHEYIIRTMIWNFPGDAKLIPTCQGNETCKSDKEREVAPDKNKEREVAPGKKGEVAPTDNNSGEGDEEAEEWIIDTGCESHMVPKLGLLKKAKCEQRSFQSASGTFDSSHIGKAQAGQLALEDVLCCPKIQSNLISGSTLDRKGHRIVFYGDRCSIAHKDSLTVQTVATMDDDDNMYVLYVPREHEGSTVKNERKRIPNKAKARVQKRARRV